MNDQPYRVCIECERVYPTAESLVDAHRVMIAQTLGTILPRNSEDPRTDPKMIWICPECGHDF